jgi:hypothetical protein
LREWTPPPGAQQAGVVVGPRRAGEREQPLPLAEGDAGSGSGSRNTWRWSKAADQADVLRQQHAVAEHVAAHVADADDRDVGRLRVDAELAEVAPHALPRPAGGDAHGLVVVAVRAAGGEGVAQPEAARLGDLVRDVRERRRALVGGDHEVRVVAVVADDVDGGTTTSRPSRRCAGRR